MREVELIQGTPQWLEFRKGRIGASDAPIILGLSEYKTAHRLWCEKTGKIEPEGANQAQMMGHAIERPARERYQEETQVNIRPAVVLHPEYDWLHASLDGVAEDGGSIVEIKLCNKDRFQRTLFQKSPLADHMIQVQVQLECVPSASHADYVFIHNDDYRIIRIKRKDISKEIKKLHEFWLSLTTGEAPVPSQEDYIDLGKDPTYKQACLEWKKASESLKEAEVKEKEARDLLIRFAQKNNVTGAGLRISRILKEGSIDYKKIPDLQKINLELYRKPPTFYFKITTITPDIQKE